MKKMMTLALTLVLAGCGSEEGGAEDAADAAAGTPSVVTPGEDPPEDNPEPDKTPVLESMTANQTGASGSDLTIQLEGSDPDRNTVRARVRVMDSAGDPVNAFRASLANAPDTHETFATFLAPVKGRQTFEAVIPMKKLMSENPTIGQLALALQDDKGNLSNELVATVGTQAVSSLGEPCDPQYVASRCSPGLACPGGSQVCEEGEAPEIRDTAYYVSETGASIVIIGDEPEDDMESLHFEFLDKQGQPVAVALTTEEETETLDYAVEDMETHGYVGDGMFAVSLTPSGDFVTQVHRIAVTPKDAAGHVGERVVMQQRIPKTVANGSMCDPWGFIGCWVNSSCVPGIPGADNRCVSHTNMQKDLCAAAPTLELKNGVVEITGLAYGASGFDPPENCTSPLARKRPEAVYKLVVPEPAATLSVTTALPGTNFDTVIYLLEGCGKDAFAHVCADDSTVDGQVSGAGSFELTDVAAGEYTLVVDSWTDQGGTFTVRVEAQ